MKGPQSRRSRPQKNSINMAYMGQKWLVRSVQTVVQMGQKEGGFGRKTEDWEF
jgi:hypothetical protein